MGNVRSPAEFTFACNSRDRRPTEGDALLQRSGSPKI